jgi:hypothetical protein
LVLGEKGRIAGGSRRKAVPHHAGGGFSMDDLHRALQPADAVRMLET